MSSDKALNDELALECARGQKLAHEVKVQVADFGFILGKYEIYKKEVEENITTESFEKYLARHESESENVRRTSTLSAYGAGAKRGSAAGMSSPLGDGGGHGHGRVTCRIFGRTRMTAAAKARDVKHLSIDAKHMSTSEILDHSTAVFSRLQQHMGDDDDDDDDDNGGGDNNKNNNEEKVNILSV
jgi:uncharacterized spore protein YtfJ